jgi:hypothetical protein
MTRAMTSRNDVSVFWDFVYQAVVIGLALMATAAIYVQITGI